MFFPPLTIEAIKYKRPNLILPWSWLFQCQKSLLHSLLVKRATCELTRRGNRVLRVKLAERLRDQIGTNVVEAVQQDFNASTPSTRRKPKRIRRLQLGTSPLLANPPQPTTTHQKSFRLRACSYTPWQEFERRSTTLLSVPDIRQLLHPRSSIVPASKHAQDRRSMVSEPEANNSAFRIRDEPLVLSLLNMAGQEDYDRRPSSPTSQSGMMPQT